jgi:hypothetical protein
MACSGGRKEVTIDNYTSFIAYDIKRKQWIFEKKLNILKIEYLAFYTKLFI